MSRIRFNRCYIGRHGYERSGSVSCYDDDDDDDDVNVAIRLERCSVILDATVLKTVAVNKIFLRCSPPVFWSSDFSLILRLCVRTDASLLFLRNMYAQAAVPFPFTDCVCTDRH